jgi:hypothetical protein
MGGEGVPGGNFDDKLHIGADGIVTAKGPLDKSVDAVNEMCVWVLQRDGTDDAIGNNMGMPDGPGMQGMPGMKGKPHELKVFDLGTDRARWMFPLSHRFKEIAFTGGSATAMAIGVFRDKGGAQRAFAWSETVLLTIADASEDC